MMKKTVGEDDILQNMRMGKYGHGRVVVPHGHQKGIRVIGTTGGCRRVNNFCAGGGKNVDA